MEVFDCTNVNSEILKIAVSTEHYVASENVEITNVSIKSGSNKGDGFVCKIGVVEFEATFAGKTLTKNYIAKYSPGGRRGELSKKFKAFEQESLIYNWLIPKLQDIRRAQKLQPLAFPKCYYASADNELILLENLKLLDYKVVEKKPELLTIEAIKLVLQELAAFHATGYYFTKTYPDGYDSLRQDYPSIFPPKSEEKKTEDDQKAPKAENQDDQKAPEPEDWIKWFIEVTTEMFGTSAKVVQKYGTEEMFGRMEAFQKTIPDVMGKLIGQKTDFKFIIHGDAWYNNFMYRYNTEDPKKPTDVMMMDMQNTRCGRPGMELAYFFCSSTSPSLRKEHFDDLFRFYYECFQREMKNLGGENQESTFSVLELKQDFDECFPFGFIQGLAHSQVLLMNEDSEAEFDLGNVGDVEGTKVMLENIRMEVLKKAESSVEYRNLILGLVDEAAKKNLI